MCLRDLRSFFFNRTTKLFDNLSVFGLAAPLALKLSIVFDNSVKLKDMMEGAYNNISDAETYPTDDLGVSIRRTVRQAWKIRQDHPFGGRTAVIDVQVHMQ